MWFLALAGALAMSLTLVRYYAERRMHCGIKALVAFSWALGFAYFLLLPFDIEHAFCRAW